MRYTLLPEHHHYFEANGSIAFSELVAPFTLPETPSRNLWTRDALLEKIVRKKTLAEIAANLTGKRPIRLLYDEMVNHRASAPLMATSPFQGVVGGWLIQPTGEGEFFSASQPCHTDEPALLVVYGTKNALYIRHPQDPYPPLPGHHYGDRLKGESHPIVLSL